MASVYLVGQRMGVDIERSLGCAPYPDAGATNAALLNTSFADSTQLNSLYVPGKRYNIQKPIIVPSTSRRIVGNGPGRAGSGDSFNFNRGTASRFVWNGGNTAFNGTSITGSAGSDTATITITGRTVLSTDVLQTVNITGGSGFLTGLYHILSVDTGVGNTWTLDRVATSGAASGMTGQFKGTMIRDDGYGNTYEGFELQGSTNYTGTVNETTRAAIGWQQRTYVDGVTPNTGKARLADMTFSDLDVGIMLGKGLGEYGAMDTDYDGEVDNNGDLCQGDRLLFSGVETCILLRSGQGVCNTFRNLSTHGKCKTLLYVERGGRISLRDVVMVTGGADGLGPVLVRLGGSGGSVASSVAAPITVTNFNLDAPTTSLKLLQMDGTGNSAGQISFEHGVINDPLVGDYYDVETPVVDLKDGWNCMLYDVAPLYPGWLRLTTTASFFNPCLTIMGCSLVGTEGDNDDVLDAPQTVLDLAGSSAGMEVRFIANFYGGLGVRKFCREGLYKIGTGWIWSHAAA